MPVVCTCLALSSLKDPEPPGCYFFFIQDIGRLLAPHSLLSTQLATSSKNASHRHKILSASGSRRGEGAVRYLVSPLGIRRSVTRGLSGPSEEEEAGGLPKIELACKQAVDRGIRFVWIDTCCINKTSSAELSEAINSMFCWYQKAAVCYAYLSDVDDLGPRFGESKWFTRGWTLQELLAPSRVVFYSSNWTELGEKTTMASILSTITRIDYFVLRGETPLHPVARQMSWAARRETTRSEDIAYSLMGIFDVNMPMLYGGGSKAFIRL